MNRTRQKARTRAAKALELCVADKRTIEQWTRANVLTADYAAIETACNLFGVFGLKYRGVK